MTSRPSSIVHQDKQTDELPHLGTHRYSTVGAMRNLPTTRTDYHRDGTPVSIRTIRTDFKFDGIIASDSCDLEKRSPRDQRAYIFLGKPMSFSHELAFLAVVSTANFTPRGYSSISSNPFVRTTFLCTTPARHSYSNGFNRCS